MLKTNGPGFFGSLRFEYGLGLLVFLAGRGSTVAPAQVGELNTVARRNSRGAHEVVGTCRRNHGGGEL